MNKIAIAGVQSNVGREILNFMAESGIKADDVVAMEPKSVLGNMVSFGEDDDLNVISMEGFDFGKIDILVLATPCEISQKFAPLALAKKVKVIDCSDAFFAEQDVPMIIAGLNDEKIKDAKRGLVAIPSSAVTQMLTPLKNINDKYLIKRIVVSTYTSTSVYGKEGMDELFNQTRKIYMNDTIVDDQSVFKKQIAFNIIPQIDDFIGDETQYEWAINAEAKKIMGNNIKVHANCAIIPAFVGSAQYINVECEDEVDVDEARDLIKKTPGVIVFDKQVDGGYVSLTDVQGENDIYVSRVRQDVSVENGLSLWCVADDLRAGTAKNAFAVMKLFMS